MTQLFNYIIPIFNKEDVLPHTLQGIDRCASREACIYTIIDGCTDKSEQVVDEFIARTRRNVVKIHMPNVHMLRSVNAALSRVQKGFTVVTQDDIILEDPDMEAKICQLYERMGERLGVISMRLAANVAPTSLKGRLQMRTLRPMITEVDFIKNRNDSQPYITATDESFYPRMGAINGPNVIPWSVRRAIGIFDETLAPYGYDDPEYGLRAMKCGFINGLFPLRYRSDEEWGGTRRNKKFAVQARRIHCRNRQYIWCKHKEYIEWLWRTGRVYRETTAVSSLAEIPNCEEGAACSHSATVETKP